MDIGMVHNINTFHKPLRTCWVELSGASRAFLAQVHIKTNIPRLTKKRFPDNPARAKASSIFKPNFLLPVMKIC
jgi:hypothetical protein